MILDTLATSTKARVEKQKSLISFQSVRRDAEAMEIKQPFCFEKAMIKNDMAFICEVKKASPSKGLIAPDFPYQTIAKEYQEAGAAAISVLTEPEYFKGSDQYLKEITEIVSIPVIRKDFTIDPYQIFEAKLLGASAVLLICSLLETTLIKEYRCICDSLGLSALVETHDEAEVESALNAGSRLIGVNNRNLKTFEVDLQNCIRLRGLVPSEIPFIAESGISTPEDIAMLKAARVNGVLIGETLMRSDNKKLELDKLRGISG